jgi:hypothetical protein
MKEFLRTLDQYASRQVDLTALRSSIEQQLAAMPGAAPDILAALAAAERAGKIDAGETKVQAEWLRLQSAVAPVAAQVQEDDRTQARTSSDTPAQPIGEGSVLKSRYLLEKKIGAGGMGMVFRACDLEQQRIGGKVQYVAIKLLQPEFRAYRDAIFQEMVETRDIAHQNIVIAYDCQQDGDDVFMTMEYLQGKTLDALLDEDYARGMPWELARPIIQGLGRGLAYAHDKGKIHCDLKPPNVFITQSFTPKILDFGIARAVRVGHRMSKSGLPVGLSRRYASPQMLRAWHEGTLDVYRPDTRDDIFAMGCVVFELLTGRHPFGELDAEQARQQQRVCPEVPGLSRQQNSAIAKAMAFDLEQRTGRVEDFLRDLLPEAAQIAPQPDIGAPRPPIRWLWPVAAGLAIVAIALGVALRPRVLNEATPPVPTAAVAPALVSPTAPTAPTAPIAPTAAGTPTTEATPTRSITTQARNLAVRLGIDPHAVKADAIKTDADLLALIRGAPRNVKLGSNQDELTAALTLCRQYVQDCDPKSYVDEQLRETTLAPFVLDAEPATVADFRAFVAATHYQTHAERVGWAYAVDKDGGLTPKPKGNWRNAVSFGQARDDWPVVAVNFGDALAYCQWKGKRLPTEDEWEYVARGPARSVFPWGDEVAPALEHPSLPPRVGAGLKEGIAGHYRDMSGVVWEWVNTDVNVDPGDGKVKMGKALKGGSWLEGNPANRRAAARRAELENRADADSGFRCAAETATWPDAEYWLGQS